MDSWFVVDVNVVEVKTKKELIQEKNRKYRLKESNQVNIERNRKKGMLVEKIKYLEDEDYHERINQHSRVNDFGYRAASKKVAVDAGNLHKHLSKDGVALVKRRYIAWKKTHPSMRDFYPQELCAENHKCLKGYDAKRISMYCRNHKFSIL